MRQKHEPRFDGTKTCRQCRQVRPLAEFPTHHYSTDGRGGTCRQCDLKRRTIAKHGMTRDEKTAIAREQGGCLICQRKAPGEKGWVVDHDRLCCPGDRSCDQCRRGVLCQWCNSALGYAMDSPALLRAMALYLERHDASRTVTPHRDVALPVTL